MRCATWRRSRSVHHPPRPASEALGLLRQPASRRSSCDLRHAMPADVRHELNAVTRCFKTSFRLSAQLVTNGGVAAAVNDQDGRPVLSASRPEILGDEIAGDGDDAADLRRVLGRQAVAHHAALAEADDEGRRRARPSGAHVPDEIREPERGPRDVRVGAGGFDAVPGSAAAAKGMRPVRDDDPERQRQAAGEDAEAPGAVAQSVDRDDDRRIGRRPRGLDDAVIERSWRIWTLERAGRRPALRGSVRREPQTQTTEKERPPSPGRRACALREIALQPDRASPVGGAGSGRCGHCTRR